MYTEGQLLVFIRKCFGDTTTTGTGSKTNINVVCPICQTTRDDNYQKRKLAIKLDTGILHCWVCGYKARSLFHLVKTYKPEFINEFVETFGSQELLRYDEEIVDSTKETLTLPNGFLLLAGLIANDSSWQVLQARDYLFGRGLSEEDLWYFKLGICSEDSYKNRVVVPSYDASGQLNFFTARTWKKGIKPTYINPDVSKNIVFNELNIDWNEELVVVEGPFDLMKAPQNATCLTGKSLSTNSKLFQQIVLHKTPVVLALDNDAKKDEINLITLLMDYGVEVKKLELPKHIKDPGSMTKMEFAKLVQTASIVDDYKLLLYKLERL